MRRDITNISCLGFARLRDDDGRYAVLVNRNRLVNHGELTLSPIGGALHFTPTGHSQLQRLGAFHFTSGLNLRFRAYSRYVDSITQWFSRREHREATALRELGEELVDETRVLPVRALRGITEEFRDGRCRRQRVDNTVFLTETYDVTVGQAAMERLQVAASKPLVHRLLYFVTAEEIMAGFTREGIKIGPHPRHLLN